MTESSLEYATSSSYPLHQVTVNFLYDLPFGPNQRWGAGTNRFVSALIGGWQAAANATMRSGLFMSYGTRNTTRWQVKDPNLPKEKQTVAKYFDTTAFVPAVDANGKPVDYYTSKRPGRNTIVGPGFRGFDMSIFKNTRIVERVNLRLVVDVFNLFNHPSWG